MKRRAWVAVLAVLVGGCVFRNASGPRYFAPDPVVVEEPAGDQAALSRKPVPIRLRSVHGISFLRERIVWRVSPVEYGRYEQRLWRELPASYVERALLTALGRTPGLLLSDDPHAAALSVEVVAFEEVLAPAHTAAVALETSLRDPRRGRLLDRTFTATAPIDRDDPETMAKAMGRALHEATSAVAVAVATAARRR
jgi:ABC-type uncharacterized transport system auxiliary subunit